MVSVMVVLPRPGATPRNEPMDFTDPKHPFFTLEPNDHKEYPEELVVELEKRLGPRWEVSPKYLGTDGAKQCCLCMRYHPPCKCPSCDCYTPRGKKRWPTVGARALKVARLLWNKPADPPASVAALFDYLQEVQREDEPIRADMAEAALQAFTPLCMAPLFDQDGPHTEASNLEAFAVSYEEALEKLETEPESVISFGDEEPEQGLRMQALLETYEATKMASLQGYRGQADRK